MYTYACTHPQNTYTTCTHERKNLEKKSQGRKKRSRSKESKRAQTDKREPGTGTTVVKTSRPRVSDSGLRVGTLANVKRLRVSMSRACTAQDYKLNIEGRKV